MRPLPVALVALAACSPVPAQRPDRSASVAEAARPPPPPPVVVEAPPVPEAPPPPPEVWLKGSTHVHAAPSGDSAEPVEDVIRWYQERGYDFIALTDHNRITDVDGGTAGQVAVHAGGLIVLAGVELTYNPGACDPPPPEPDGKCRIHANLIGPTARPEGKQSWALGIERRLDAYQAAIDRSREWGGLVQINHPQWHWGMTAELLTELAGRGARLVEIANKQFARWNAGSDVYPSTEALWDAALTAGATIWGVASDDAHDYAEDGGGSYPAGGSYVVVRAARDPDAIVAALAAGRFYASTGVALDRAEVDAGELVVEVAADSPGEHVIAFVGDGKLLAEHRGRAARHPLAAGSYVRAVVTRDDGAKAWVQPARAAAAGDPAARR